MKTYNSSVVRRRAPFPPGRYRGTINEAAYEERDNRASVGFQLQNNDLIEGNRDPGKRPHFVRLLVWQDIDGEPVNVYDADLENAETPVNIRRDGQAWIELAMQLGAATEDKETRTINFSTELETFIEEFRNGEYNEAEVTFAVSHSQNKKQNGEPYVNTYFSMRSDTEETPAAEEDTGTDNQEEDETPAPPAARTTVANAKARQTTTKTSGAPKAAPASSKRKFVKGAAAR